jgi:hypothetical protein
VPTLRDRGGVAGAAVPGVRLSLAGVDGRPGPYSKAALWWTGGGFLVIYLITLAIVTLTH